MLLGSTMESAGAGASASAQRMVGEGSESEVCARGVRVREAP